MKVTKEETVKNMMSVVDRLMDLDFRGNIVLPVKDREIGMMRVEWFIDQNSPPAILKKVQGG